MKRFIGILAAVLCLTVLLSVTAFAEEGTAFGGFASVSGSSVKVYITVEDTGIHSAQLTVKYDTSAVTYVSAKLGDKVKDAITTSIDDKTAGEVEFGFATITSVEPGVVLELEFTGAAVGLSFPVSVTEYGTGVGEGVNNAGFDYVITLRSASGGGGGTIPGAAPSTDPDVTTGDTSDNGETVTGTTATPGAVVSGGGASSEVTDAMGEEIVRQAEDNDSDVVIIEPEIPGAVTRTEVTVPSETVAGIGGNTGADLEIRTPVADVTIPNEALEDIAKGGDLKVSAELSDGAVTVSITAGGRDVGSVPGGVRAVLPLKDGEVVVLVAGDGTETIIPKSLVENGMTYVLLDGSGTVKVINNSKSFTDVKTGDWFKAYVDFASSHELVNGTGDGTAFEPSTNMSRSMLATVLWRLESEAGAAGSVTFPDVKAGEWYERAVAWASENGIVKGYDNGSFGTDDPVTRQELAVMIYRYAKLAGIDTGKSAGLDSFTDGGNTADWASEAMSWAVSAGVLNGKDGGRLDPTGTASRAEVAAVLQRVVENLLRAKA